MKIRKLWKEELNDLDRFMAKFGASIIAGLLALVVVSAVVQASAKSAAWEHVTGKHVSIWDAYWLDLKVQEPVR